MLKYCKHAYNRNGENEGGSAYEFVSIDLWITKEVAPIAKAMDSIPLFLLQIYLLLIHWFIYLSVYLFIYFKFQQPSFRMCLRPGLVCGLLQRRRLCRQLCRLSGEIGRQLLHLRGLGGDPSHTLSGGAVLYRFPWEVGCSQDENMGRITTARRPTRRCSNTAD